MKRNTTADVVVHELGHALESHNVELHGKLVHFLKRRTEGLEPVNLRNVSPTYEEDEIAIEDDFTEPYIGKIYNGYEHTEVLTMGLQYFVRSPETLAAKNPQMFNFIYDLLREQPEKPK